MRRFFMPSILGRYHAEAGMHVYAPGATGYRVIALNIEPQAHVRTMPLRYPRSEIYHFVPLDERVPVYQKPFTLLMEVVPDATAEARKAGRQKRADYPRHAGVPSLRRQDLPQPCLTAAVLEDVARA